MIQAETAIARLRRDLTVSALIRGCLMLAAVVSMGMEVVGKPHMIGGAGLLALIGLVWLLLSYQSVKSSRMAAVSPSLIAAGDFEQAEEAIDGALKSFSLFRSVKLRALHHLAALRHAQRRWGEAAMLCQALLSQKPGTLSGVSRSAKLMLADALLEAGDVQGAYRAISSLQVERLSLAEALELTAAQLDYLARIGQWDVMLGGLKRKVEMIELMPAGKSARAQALLALAARKKGLAALEAWLKKRVELLADISDVVAGRPMVGELWRSEQ
jgi:hypothetical protein